MMGVKGGRGEGGKKGTTQQRRGELYNTHTWIHTNIAECGTSTNPSLYGGAPGASNG